MAALDVAVPPDILPGFLEDLCKLLGKAPVLASIA